MPRRVAPDEQAVEVAAGADFGVQAAEDLRSYDARENALHRQLLSIVDTARERDLVQTLIAGDEIEKRKISRSAYISHLIAQHARRLAGVLTVQR